MNFKSLHIGALAVLLGLFSCSQDETHVVKPFQDVLDFKDVAAGLDSTMRINKQLLYTNKIESIERNKSNWKVELSPFIEANFNRPSNKDNYLKTEQISTLSGWRDVTWVGTDSKSPVKWAIYRYDGEDCIGAVLHVDIDSEGYQLNEILTYIPNKGYSIDNSQDLKYVSDEQFYLSAEFMDKPQSWRMFFELNEINIPVNFDLSVTNNNLTLTFIQGKESISTTAIKTDSGYIAEMPIFQSYLHFNITDNTISGNFHNLDKGPNYIIPFTAIKLPYDKIISYNPTETYPDFSGKWETYFNNDDGTKTPAIGLFDRLGNDLIGTFATETGDYRFLQGKIIGDSFSLSTFDGSHLFLFTGKITGNEITDGHFYSGNHYHTTWTAKRNNEFELTDPDKMTELTEEKFDFSFPDLHGNQISLSDEQFKNKVIIIQVLGSWCPNCMDETRYFVDLYKKYHGQGLEIIGLAFERSSDFNTAKNSLQKAIKEMNVPYTMLIAGTPRESASILTMIDKVKSYPTSIYMDRNGKVVKVHTGFYGPSTGTYYTDYTNETETLIEKLLAK